VPDRSEDRAARRLDRLVSGLLAGRRLGAGAADAAEQGAIRRASQLAACPLRTPHMTAAFRERLAAQLLRRAPTRSLSRRALLAAGVSAAGGAALATGVDRALGTQAVGAPPPSSVVLAPATSAGRWIDVGVALDALEEGAPVRASAGAIRVFVVRRGSAVIAVSALCTHQPCELVWNASGRLLGCPCHGARFSAGGDALSVDFPHPLPLARTRVRSGRVEVLGTDSAPR
jgi:Rieske Fe-S protein